MGYEKVFFSYSRVDGEQAALKLASDLRKLNANIWIDQLDIKAGTLWDEEIERALEGSDCILFIATPKSTSSNNVLNEVYFALEENKHVIPLIFGDCKIPFRLKRLQHIDFTTDYDYAFQRLIETLDIEPGAKASQRKHDAPANPGIQAEFHVPPEHNHGKQLKEELLWGKAVNSNTNDSYDEYLVSYPNGKFCNLAMQKKEELLGLENALREDEIRRSNVRGSTNYNTPKKGSNSKTPMIVGICIGGLLLVGVAAYFIMNRQSSYSGYSNESPLLSSYDSSTNSSSASQDIQQPSTEEVNKPLLSEKGATKSLPDPSEKDASKLKEESTQKPYSSAADYDALIYEKLPGTWYETFLVNDGLTYVGAQTYHKNGNLEGVATYKNSLGAIVSTVSYVGIWSVTDGYLYEEVTSSSVPALLAVGYNQRTRVTSINNDAVGYIDTEGIQRTMFRYHY